LNKRIKVLLVVIAALLAFDVALNLREIVLNAQAGSPSDPLVTKSYVDAQIAALRDELNAEFSPVFLTAGQILEGGGGAEIIFRSGRAAAFVPEGNINGVTDVTLGVDLMNGAMLSLNHLIIIPRTDGRGVQAVGDSWFMVKGSYSIR
jgi:hypothetical protein